MNLLHRIERYLRRSGVAVTRFGREAVNDPRLIADLRAGRELRPATLERITAYLTQAEAAPR